MEKKFNKLPDVLMQSISADKWEELLVNPIFKINGIELVRVGDIKVCISHEGKWCFIVKEKIYYLTLESNITPFFPCLEVDCKDFYKITLNTLRSKQMPLIIIKYFPIYIIINVAMEMTSDYWTKLSIAWLECYQFDSVHILLLLKEIMSSNWASQKTRHLAKSSYYKLYNMRKSENDNGEVSVY